MISVDYQKIYDLISSCLIDDWNRIVIRCVRWTGSLDTIYYVRDSLGSYRSCYEIDFPQNEITETLVNISELLDADKECWHVLTVVIDSTGDFHAEADYSGDLDELDVFEHGWKETYLN